MKNFQRHFALTTNLAGYALIKDFTPGLLKYFTFGFLVLSSFGLLKCQSVTPSKQIIQSVPCSGKIKYYKSGELRSCCLAQDYKVEGVTLPAGSGLFLSKDGSPSGCRISKETNFYGQMLPAHTSVFFNRWGAKLSFWLPQEMRVQGHLIPSTHDGIGNSLFPNGKLRAIWLAGDEDINGVPCSSSRDRQRFGKKVLSLGTKRMAWFYDNGNLQQAMLSRDITIQGYSFQKGDVISFDTEGKVDLNAKKLE